MACETLRLRNLKRKCQFAQLMFLCMDFNFIVLYYFTIYLLYYYLIKVFLYNIVYIYLHIFAFLFNVILISFAINLLLMASLCPVIWL